MCHQFVALAHFCLKLQSQLEICQHDVLINWPNLANNAKNADSVTNKLRLITSELDSLTPSRGCSAGLLDSSRWRKYYTISTLHYNWPMSVHASQAFSVPIV